MHQYIENHLTIDRAFFDFADKFNSQYSFALLSNDVLAWNKYILDYYYIRKYFSDCIISAQVHMRKPDTAIYEKAVARIGAAANECIFIDNSVKNLIAANKIGMDTVLFNRDDEEYDGKTVYSFEELGDLISGI